MRDTVGVHRESLRRDSERVVPGRFHLQIREALNHRVRVRQGIRRACGGHADHSCPGALGGRDSSGGIFQDETLLGGHGQSPCRQKIGFRMRLSRLHVVGRDEPVRLGQARVGEPGGSRFSSAAWCNGPPVFAQRLEQRLGTVEGREAFGVFGLAGACTGPLSQRRGRAPPHG